MIGIRLGELYNKKKEILKLELLTKACKLDQHITIADINRTGLAFAGYLDHFAYNRIQILGNVETYFLGNLKSENIRQSILNILTKFDIPCFIITNGLTPPAEVLEECIKFDVPVFRTHLQTSDFVREIVAYLEEEIAPRISIHGVLLGIYGLGVILTGNSGIGKSECALDLIKKGHQLVSDDIVNIKKKPGGILSGFSNDFLEFHMEIRGLGIINIKHLFGVSSTLDKTNIDFVVQLEEWDTKKTYDRVGAPIFYENILGIEVPKIILPVKPGRNLAGLIEVATMKHRLKNQGYDTLKELNYSLNAKLEKNLKEKPSK